jgi:hypothetical protein
MNIKEKFLAQSKHIKTENYKTMKSRFVAFILAVIWSALGINEMYVGNITLGICEACISILSCILATFWGFFVIPILVITVINIICGWRYIWCNSDEEFNEKYVKKD